MNVGSGYGAGEVFMLLEGCDETPVAFSVVHWPLNVN